MPSDVSGNPASSSARLVSLFPVEVAAAELRGVADIALLYPEERKHVERSAERRIRDFSGGRLCARLALAELGVHNFPLCAGEDRRALWPSGIVGSITHTKGFCAAVAARCQIAQSVGIDAEVIERVTDPMLGMICTGEEQDWIHSLDSSGQTLATALAFSCKEAFYKCQYPLSRQWLDFTDVRLVPERTRLSEGRFALQLLKPVEALADKLDCLEGRFVVDGPLIISTMAFSPSLA